LDGSASRRLFNLFLHLYDFLTLTLYFLHVSLHSGLLFDLSGLDDASRGKSQGVRWNVGGAMGIWDLRFWDQFAVYFVAGVFVSIGLAKVFRYRRGPRPVGAQPARLPLGLPYGSLVAVGVFEVLAALALVMPAGVLPQAVLAQVAIAGLALLTVTACLYHARRRESMVPNLTLFLLVLFVAVARWV
jgi:hypothetical protein